VEASILHLVIMFSAQYSCHFWYSLFPSPALSKTIWSSCDNFMKPGTILANSMICCITVVSFWAHSSHNSSCACQHGHPCTVHTNNWPCITCTSSYIVKSHGTYNAHETQFMCYPQICISLIVNIVLKTLGCNKIYSVITYIVTYKGFAWLIIPGSGFDDWVYWHFFTITLNYNSSHIELLLNDVCLTNVVWRIRDCIKCMNELPFITVTWPKYKSPCWAVNCSLLFCVIHCSGNISNSSSVILLSVAMKHFMFSNLLPANDSFIAICCSGNVISEPLLSNRCLLQLQHFSSHVTMYWITVLRPIIRMQNLNYGNILYVLALDCAWWYGKITIYESTHGSGKEW
jgi:hypothetical protein